ncbi:hypothetical protein ACQKWADRAFT_301763 [Trichoderma austrokoningii]
MLQLSSRLISAAAFCFISLFSPSPGKEYFERANPSCGQFLMKDFVPCCAFVSRIHHTCTQEHFPSAVHFFSFYFRL